MKDDYDDVMVCGLCGYPDDAISSAPNRLVRIRWNDDEQSWRGDVNLVAAKQPGDAQGAVCASCIRGIRKMTDQEIDDPYEACRMSRWEAISFRWWMLRSWIAHRCDWCHKLIWFRSWERSTCSESCYHKWSEHVQQQDVDLLF